MTGSERVAEADSSSSAVDTPAVEDRLAALWPAAGLRRARLPRLAKGSATREYLLLPRMSNPVLVLPTSGPRPAEAILAEAGRGRRGRALSTAYRLGALRWLPIGRLLVTDADSSPALQAIRAIVPRTEEVVIRLGRHRPGRALVLACQDARGDIVAFAKAGTGRGKEAVLHERRGLAAVNRHRPSRILAPRLLGYRELPGANLLVMSTVSGGPVTLLPGDDERVAAMHELALSAGVRHAPLRDSGQVARVAGDLAELPQSEWLRRAFEQVLSRYGDTEVGLGAWHGDWVSWNQQRTGAALALWDWEHYEQDVPLGMDLVHYAAQQLRRFEGVGVREERAWLEQLRGGLLDDWELSEEQIEATLRWYLVVVNARFLLDRQDSPSITERSGWARTLVEELNRQ